MREGKKKLKGGWGIFFAGCGVLITLLSFPGSDFTAAVEYTAKIGPAKILNIF